MDKAIEKLFKKVFYSNDYSEENAPNETENNKKLELLETIDGGIPIKEFEEKYGTDTLLGILELCAVKNGNIFLNEKGEKELRRLKGEYDSIVEKLKDEIERVEFYPARTNEDVGFYKIWINGKIIEISIDKLMTPRYFCAMYYDRFKKYIKISNKGEESEWSEILDYLGEKCVIVEPDYIDSEQFIVDEIISRIQDCTITRDIKKAVDMWNYIYLNGNELYYPSLNIKKIIKDARFGIKLRRLRSLLDPYLMGNTVVKRVGSKTIRFWVFDPYKLEINIEEKLEDEEEDEENEDHQESLQ